MLPGLHPPPREENRERIERGGEREADGGDVGNGIVDFIVNHVFKKMQ